MADAFCYLQPQKVRLVVALLTFGAFFLWILLGNYSHLPSPADSDAGQRTTLLARSSSEATGRRPLSGRRLLSVNESTGTNCSVVHLMTKAGVVIDIDHDSVRPLLC